jgi:hypothetical protein
MDSDHSASPPSSPPSSYLRGQSFCVVSSKDETGLVQDTRVSCDWGCNGPELRSELIARKHGLQSGSVFLQDKRSEECIFDSDGVFFVVADEQYWACGTALLHVPSGDCVALRAPAVAAMSQGGMCVTSTSSSHGVGSLTTMRPVSRHHLLLIYMYLIVKGGMTRNRQLLYPFFASTVLLDFETWFSSFTIPSLYIG